MKNKDDLIEKIISEHREKFDFHNPPAGIWENIERELPKPKTRIFQLNTIKLLLAAASFICIGIVGAKYLVPQNNDPEVEQLEKYYGANFTVQYNQLAQNRTPDADLLNELKALEAIEEELKEEIKNNYGDTRKMMIKRLLDHYQTKIKLIELINEKTDTFKNTEI